eukprot:TRINITY_DN4444_c0_g1::TRINITY_DN4444_c0_g1_i1::g.7254::m.7254 TRINITY_DN4444_c0_g1::TRINITY_DN4444_c0_g1_i1::g.7254  ORF type:complete len:930 (-),score=263.40,sp/P29240/5NTD_DIPOM/25.46/4e-33,5_nucleotid_C/PF02872.13/1.3e-33,EF-hand_7/PF13499.1/3.4e-13,EF-hand_1/PF00036.27/2.1e-05,EF-hand_1/PF00036.27/0.009,EF-hand_6/PF13405.1/2.5e-05,EF-hand_6/PF13405.1/0.43,EF-hand_8/PF13833.1/0.34,EF-hand_8/PF13833.1/0.00049,EF-hand_5/PF13202.1/0.0098,EF-hand_5/PF13202.1/0.21,Metallophos/PF00149.23/0.0064,SP
MEGKQQESLSVVAPNGEAAPASKCENEKVNSVEMKKAAPVHCESSATVLSDNESGVACSEVGQLCEAVAETASSAPADIPADPVDTSVGSVSVAVVAGFVSQACSSAPSDCADSAPLSIPEEAVASFSAPSADTASEAQPETQPEAQPAASEAQPDAQHEIGVEHAPVADVLLSAAPTDMNTPVEADTVPAAATTDPGADASAADGAVGEATRADETVAAADGAVAGGSDPSTDAGSRSGEGGAAHHTRRITIAHFNDVYCITEGNQEPVGGASRFATSLKSFQSENPLLLFSGDAFSPSLMSTVTKGKQMVPVLNQLAINYALIGNHDFDFGMGILQKHLQHTTFPWLLSNVDDTATGAKLAGAKESVIFDWQGIKIGLMGLVEYDWFETIPGLPPTCSYKDFVSEGRRIGTDLRKQGVDVLIALTHMRVDNDQKCCRELGDIVDLVLGGHDHFYTVQREADFQGCVLVKSGADFRDLSIIRMTVPERGTARPSVVDVQHVEVTSAVPEDPDMKAVVDQYASIVSEKMKKVIFQSDAVLDMRMEAVRTRESEWGNFVTDVMRHTLAVDIAVLNGGCCRSDTTFGPGPVTIENLLSIFPSQDAVIIKEMTGKDVREMMEVSVGKYPTHAGRFLHVSGLKIEFDPSRDAGSRVVAISLADGSELLPDTPYRVAMRGYMGKGMDGFTLLNNCRTLVDDENAQEAVTMLRNYFTNLKVLAIGAAVSGDDAAAEGEGDATAPIEVVKLTDEETEEYRRVFDAFDVNGDQTISLDELEEVFRKMGVTAMTPHRIRKLLEMVDHNRDNVISFPEFLSMISAERNRTMIPKISPKIEGRIVCLCPPADHL